MTKYIGRRISVGLAKESTRGTAVSPTYWLPHKGVKHERKVEYAFNDSAQGTIMDNVGAEITKEFSEGGFDSLIGDKHMGLVLYALLGTLSTATKSGESIVYEHTFTLAETATHQSLTIGLDEAQADKRFALAVLDTLSIAFERGKILEYSAKFMSKKPSTGTSLTPAAVSENIFRPQDFQLKFASSLAGLDAASETLVQSFSIQFNKNVEADDVLGDTEPQDFLNKQVEVTGEFTMIYNATTEEDYAFNNTVRAMRIKLTNSGTTIGSASNPDLKIDLAKCTFTEVSHARGLDNIVMVTVAFKGAYSTSDSSFGNIVLTNLVSSY